MTQELLPKIPKISIIVMDNAAFPKRQDIQDSLTSAAHTLDSISIPLSPSRLDGVSGHGMMDQGQLCKRGRGSNNTVREIAEKSARVCHKNR